MALARGRIPGARAVDDVLTDPLAVQEEEADGAEVRLVGAMPVKLGALDDCAPWCRSFAPLDVPGRLWIPLLELFNDRACPLPLHAPGREIGVEQGLGGVELRQPVDLTGLE